MTPYRAVILAGGAASRLGGVAKPAVPVGGRRMLDWVLSAVVDASTIVVVGPAGLGLPPGVRRAQEEPPGGGPAAAIGAAMASFAAAPPGSPPPGTVQVDAGPLSAGPLDDAGLIVIVGGDLPLLRPASIELLTDAAIQAGLDGAVFVDKDSRPQWLCGAWRTPAIQERLDALTAVRGTLAGASLRALFEPLRFAQIRHDDAGLPPFYDCDTDEEIRRVEEWLTR